MEADDTDFMTYETQEIAGHGLGHIYPDFLRFVCLQMTLISNIDLGDVKACKSPPINAECLKSKLQLTKCEFISVTTKLLAYTWLISRHMDK